MLEFHKNNCTMKIVDLNHLITVVYVIVDDIYQTFTPTHIKERRNINTCILSDSEIITISIVGELLTIDSENAWFNFCKKNLRHLFPKFCDRTRFNRTRRSLHKVIEEIMNKTIFLLGYEHDPHRIADSMPIPVCKFGRARFHKTFKGFATYGVCPSKKETYLGFKLHLLVTLNGFVTNFILTKANADDREPLFDLVESYRSITIIGDKGYIGDTLASELKSERDITLIAMKKGNSKTQYPKAFRQTIFKLRRRIETSNSQLCTQLNIERVLAKSTWGLITRIKTKLLAFDLCLYINKLLGKDIDIAKIKELVFG